jgi:hypothetical protein
MHHSFVLLEILYPCFVSIAPNLPPTGQRIPGRACISEKVFNLLFGRCIGAV